MTKQLSTDERMALNAAMTKLISGEEEGWLDAACLVAEFGQTIPPGRYLDETLCEWQGGESASGYAAGIGNASIQDDENKPQHEEKTSGQAVERVGQFKIIHYAENKAVRFWHYRKDLLWDPEEMSRTPDYVVYYDDAGKAHTLAQPVWERRFSWRDIFVWLQLYLKGLILRWKHSSWRAQFEIRVERFYCAGVVVIRSTNSYLPPGTFIPTPYH
jgi:hypothetical protein